MLQGGGDTRTAEDVAMPEDVNSPSGAPEEAVVEMDAESTITRVLSATAFGYPPATLLGQPLLAVTHPEDRQQLLHMLQVLLRMDEMARMMVSGAQPSQQQAIRVCYRVLSGLGQGTGQPTIVPVESVISATAAGTDEKSKLLVRSRQRYGVDEREGFCILAGAHM